MVSDNGCEIYMILRGGLLKTHPVDGPGRWCQIMDVKYI